MSGLLDEILTPNALRRIAGAKSYSRGKDYCETGRVQTVKCEEVYLREYAGVGEAHSGLTRYFAFYNGKRRHQSLSYRTGCGGVL